MAGMRLVDSHAHLQSPQFSDDLAEVLAAAEVGRRRADPRAGLGRGVVACAPSSSSARFPRLVAAAGIHPHAAAETDDAALGADGSPGRPTRRSSRSARPGSTTTAASRRSRTSCVNLRRNLALALAIGKPAILHCRSAAGQRDAQDALLDEMRAAGFGGAAARAAFGDRPPAILHSVSGPADYVAAAIELGCAVSISGLCFRKGEEATAESVRLVPGRPAPGRDRRAVPVAARRSAPPQRARVGPDHGRLGGGAARRASRRARGAPRRRPSTGSSRRGSGRGARRHRRAGEHVPAEAPRPITGRARQPRRRQPIVIDGDERRPGSTTACSPVLRPFGGPVWGSTQTPSSRSV